MPGPEKAPPISAPIGSPFSLATHRPVTGSRIGIAWQWQIFVFVTAVLAVVSRRPDALFHPGFFAEDGTIWYADAYNFGWLHSLLNPQNGYFQTLPRLTAALALLVPLQFAPLLMNGVAIVLQVLPVNLLLSSRCATWGPLSVRALFALAYVCLPNSRELDATITEGQWHIALLASIVILASPAKSWAWRTFDIFVIFLCGLTGPFCLLLLPVGVAFWWMRRDRWRLFLIAAIAACSLLQVSALYFTASTTRAQMTLGATPQLFLKLLAGQVYLGAVIGQNTLAANKGSLLLDLVAILGTAFIVYCLLKAQLELKFFIVFCALIYAASLKNPMAAASTAQSQWQVLSSAPGVRYWFFPMLAFIWALIWCASSSRSTPVRVIAACCLATMLIGITHDWKYPAYTNTRFPEYARRFASASEGTLITIPLFPDGWVVRLAKKGSVCQILPMGTFDTPAPNTRLPDQVTANGWVTAPQPIERVSLYIDHAFVKAVVPDVQRPDVDKFYLGSPNKDKGWGAVLDASHIAPGKHELEARALEKGGCDAEFATVSVERAP